MSDPTSRPEKRTANLIAFTGLATSGKTTAAKPLTAKGFRLISFATPVKRMVEVLTLCRDKSERPEVLCGKTIREVYQSLGTDWGRRMVGDDIWVNIGRNAIQSELACEDTRGVVLDDLRFNNEALCVKQLGGIVVEVRRHGLVRMEHASEAGVSPELVDLVIENTGSETDLQLQVMELFGLQP